MRARCPGLEPGSRAVGGGFLVGAGSLVSLPGTESLAWPLLQLPAKGALLEGSEEGFGFGEMSACSKSRLTE